MHLLFLFLDGVGLGENHVRDNPFALVEMPTIQNLLGGKKLLACNSWQDTSYATLLPLDACLEVPGLPQSATGQAAIMTGLNIPAQLGCHYGPKPNPPIAGYLKNGNLFNQLLARNLQADFINAYPPRYFDAIQTGRRNHAAIPMAATSAGIGLKTAHDLIDGQALAADFTAAGWHSHLGITDVPVISPRQAGQQLAQLATQRHFTLFEYWLSDYAGHRQDMPQAAEVLRQFDEVLAGLLEAWDWDSGVILITSDHGNLEDLSTRHHTLNPVPCLVIGRSVLRSSICRGLTKLTDIAPAIQAFFDPLSDPPQVPPFI